MVDWSTYSVALAVVVAFVGATVAGTVISVLALVSWATATADSLDGLDVGSLVALLWLAGRHVWLGITSDTFASADLLLASSATTVLPVFHLVGHVASTRLGGVVVDRSS